MLANRLAAGGFATTVFDPAALMEAQRSLAPSISRASGLAKPVFLGKSRLRAPARELTSIT